MTDQTRHPTTGRFTPPGRIIDADTPPPREFPDRPQTDHQPTGQQVTYADRAWANPDTGKGASS
jgi:hypothetical protein